MRPRTPAFQKATLGYTKSVQPLNTGDPIAP